MKRPFPALPLLAAATALGGCATEGDFPSLALRPAERSLSFEEPERAPVTVANDPDLETRLAELLSQAADGDRAFREALDPAASAVAAAGSTRSDSWVVAQEALSRLEASRAPTTRALADLDRLRLDRASTPISEADFAAIDRAMQSVGGLAAGQQDRIDRLRAALAS